VVSVTGDKDIGNEAPTGRLAVYLERHGVQVSVEVLTMRNASVADTISDHVLASGSSMIVMGAFAHSRFREAILGGVTRSLLGFSPVPLFFSH
jgi:nucleotide-binding universal stress UspA family protein